MTSHHTPAGEHRTVATFLGEVASACGSLLNSLMVTVGDRLGLYRKGQYSFEEEPRRAPTDKR